MAFRSRISPPSQTNTNYMHVSKGGKNSCILISGNSVLPNCVGYAWGRAMEILGKTPKLSRRDAKDWYAYKADGYKRGKKPKLGAVICWSGGTRKKGHVAIVEDVFADGTILISQSGYGGPKFWLSRVKPPYNLSGYIFQGFIYLPLPENVLQKEDIIVNLSLKQLSYGDKGYEVKTIQRILYCYFNCPKDFAIDGNFGKITKKYVKRVQQILKLEDDCIVGSKTWNGLLKLL